MSKKVPKLRFSGFDEEWEEHKLGDVFTFSKGKGLPLDTFVNDNHSPAIAYGHLYTKYSEVIDEVKFSSDDSGVLSRKNDVLFPGSSTVPNGTAQANAIMIDDVKLGGDIIIARNISGCYTDGPFLSYQINSQRTKLYPITVGTTITHMYGKDLAKLSFSFPDFQEQKKIGKLFKAIDTLISLRERRLDLLKEQKRGFLQKLFPKTGETVPELRFNGFADDWEEFNFGDIFDFPVSTNSLSRAMLNYDNGEIKNVHYGDVLIKYTSILDVKNDEIPYITDSNLEKYETNLLSNGDLIFADAAEDETVGKAVEVIGITNEYLVSGLHTIVARSKYEKAPYFLGYYINSNIYHKQLLRLMQGSKVSSISKGNLLKTNVSFPKNIFEQEKIGKFLKKLDNNISYQQSNVNLLKEQKKGLLHTIFI